MQFVQDTFEEYSAKELLSRAKIIDALKSPSLYFKRHIIKQFKQEATPAMLKGILLHKAILEPEEFDSLAIMQPDFGDLRSPANRKIKQDWMASLEPQRIILTPDDLIEIENFRNVTNKLGIFNNGKAEISCYSDTAKARFDYVTDDTIYDLKFVSDASQQGFIESAKMFRYDIQAAFYLQLFGKPNAKFKFVNLEKKTYEFSITEFSPVTLNNALLDISKAQSIIQSQNWNDSYGEHIISW